MLSKKEKELLEGAWSRLTPVAEYIGADALLRMFTTFPGSKTYFSHLDISPGSNHLFTHGKKIVLAIADGAQNISQLTVTLAPLQTLHAYLLRIDPSNFKHFSQCMLVSLAVHMGEDFTEVLHAAMDKYLSAFAAVLAEKYR
ncbi:hemoglobin subunit alpha-D-like [Phyllopteryx taeniolatus]|uniref:hemoglobin subunit alpha-D-like n=1 Tax=Phyllopteryx taeniolatus TaxID=161469 RepID=UPI002AD5A623|nr:hemoglobin subunit alpha-D-like [Phyllopteryx taeniolatus]XP_061612133.1 hemoglobin subunit alpha-D-like [Phyllopteryx taeniolatus]